MALRVRIADRAFFERDARVLAKELLGKILVHEEAGVRLALRITETEAYLGVDDLASHSRGGRRTRRNEVMFGQSGQVYMFLIYGLHYCFNITANRAGCHEAVLIRSGEPLEGLEGMVANRRLKEKSRRDLANGPGKLCQALALDGSHYGLDLTDPANQTVWIEGDDFKVHPGAIQSDARVGVDYAGKDRLKPWRYYLKTSSSVSLTKEQHLRRRTRQTNVMTEEDDKR